MINPRSVKEERTLKWLQKQWEAVAHLKTMHK
jgi:hypothetical protein